MWRMQSYDEREPQGNIQTIDDLYEDFPTEKYSSYILVDWWIFHETLNNSTLTVKSVIIGLFPLWLKAQLNEVERAKSKAREILQRCYTKTKDPEFVFSHKFREDGRTFFFNLCYRKTSEDTLLVCYLRQILEMERAMCLKIEKFYEDEDKCKRHQIRPKLLATNILKSPGLIPEDF